MKKYILAALIALSIPFVSRAASVADIATTTDSITLTPSIDQTLDMAANGYTTADWWMGVLVDNSNGNEYLTIDRSPSNSPIAIFNYTSHAEAFYNLPSHAFTYKILGTIKNVNGVFPNWAGQHSSGNPYPAGTFTASNDGNPVKVLYSQSISLAVSGGGSGGGSTPLVSGKLTNGDFGSNLSSGVYANISSTFIDPGTRQAVAYAIGFIILFYVILQIKKLFDYDDTKYKDIQKGIDNLNRGIAETQDEYKQIEKVLKR